MSLSSSTPDSYEIIDDAGGALFVIEQLAVQQMEPGVDQLTAVMNDR